MNTKALPPTKTKSEKISVDLDLFNPVTNTSSVGTNTPITTLQPKPQKAIPRYVNLSNNNISGSTQKAASVVNRSNSAGSVKSNVISPANSNAILNTSSQPSKKSSSTKPDESIKQPIKLSTGSLQSKEPSNVQPKTNLQKDFQQQPIKMTAKTSSSSSIAKKDEVQTNQLNKPSILTKSSSNLEKKSGMTGENNPINANNLNLIINHF